jgi:cytochrome c-type biogenesis protein CcmE
MKPRQKRLAIAAGIVCAVGVAAALVLNAFQSNLVFFYSPSQVAAREAPSARTFRLGGLVEKGTLKREGTKASFVVTDTAKSITVKYEGILPDLFKEGKGVVAQGQLQGDVFVAREVLAKHDENYMPPEAAEALKRAQQGNPKLAESMDSAPLRK